MNPNSISHSPTSPEHLYQNYHIDYIIPGVKDNLNIIHTWYEDIEECIRQTNPIPRKIDKSQLDLRESSYFTHLCLYLSQMCGIWN